MNAVALEDRGLSAAYERYCLYQRLESWAEEYGVETMLEGPFDGFEGIAGVHGVGLAKRGVKVVSVVPSEEHARVVRAVHDGCGTNVDVVVGTDVSALPRAELVFSCNALDRVPDWRGYLHDLAKLATKAVVVVVPNSESWGARIMRTVAKVRRRGAEAPAWSRDLAPELWSIGRVRAHTYFDAPWWPDFGIQTRASTLVFGPGRWPYLGGAEFRDELLPALLRHPSFEGSKDDLRRRTAHLHAFVVDVRPRTPRQRRKLVMAAT